MAVSKPNLFIAGAPKCGTTAWSEYLSTHPDIGFCEVKEPIYFCFDFPEMRLTHSIGNYLALFTRQKNKKVLAEGSVAYFPSRVAATEIFKFNSDAKIIIFLRRQEDFLLSLHNDMLRRREDDLEDFEEAWRQSGKRKPPRRCKCPPYLDYKEMGNFSKHVERYFSVFPEEQIRVFHFDNWTKNPRETYLEILRFLGLDDDGRTTFPPTNEARMMKSRAVAVLTQNPPRVLLALADIARRILGKKELGWARRLRALNIREGYQSSMSPQLRDEIRAHYRADNARLSRTIWGGLPEA